MFPITYAKSLHEIITRIEMVAEREENLAEIATDTLQHVSGELTEYEKTGKMYSDFDETQHEFEFGPNMFGEIKDIEDSEVEWCDNASVYAESVMNLTLACAPKINSFQEANTEVVDGMNPAANDQSHIENEKFCEGELDPIIMAAHAADLKFHSQTKNQDSYNNKIPPLERHSLLLPDEDMNDIFKSPLFCESPLKSSDDNQEDMKMFNTPKTSRNSTLRNQKTLNGLNEPSTSESASEDCIYLTGESVTKVEEDQDQFLDTASALARDECDLEDDILRSPLFCEQEVLKQNKDARLPKMNESVLNNKLITESGHDKCSTVEPQSVCEQDKNKKKFQSPPRSSESLLNLDFTIVNGRSLRKRTSKSKVERNRSSKSLSKIVTDRDGKEGCVSVHSTRSCKYGLRSMASKSPVVMDRHAKSASKPARGRSYKKDLCYSAPAKRGQLCEIGSKGRMETRNIGALEPPFNSPGSSLCVVLDRIEI